MKFRFFGTYTLVDCENGEREGMSLFVGSEGTIAVFSDGSFLVLPPARSVYVRPGDAEEWRRAKVVEIVFVCDKSNVIFPVPVRGDPPEEEHGEFRTFRVLIDGREYVNLHAMAWWGGTVVEVGALMDREIAGLLGAAVALT